MKTALMFVLVLCLLSGVLFVRSAKASQTTVFIDPQWNYVDVGENFTVEVRIDNVMDLYAWQVALSFNSSVLNALNVTYAPDSVFNGNMDIITVTPVVDNARGYVLHGECLLGPVPGVNASGGLLQVTFAVIGHGQSSLHLVREGEGILPEDFASFLLDSSVNEIDFASIDGHHHNHLLADITGIGGKPDGRVNMVDVAYLVVQFGTTPASSKWNPKADLNGDNKVNMEDIAIAMQNFNFHWP
jgi:hypothetical protein